MTNTPITHIIAAPRQGDRRKVLGFIDSLQCIELIVVPAPRPLPYDDEDGYPGLEGFLEERGHLARLVNLPRQMLDALCDAFPDCEAVGKLAAFPRDAEPQDRFLLDPYDETNLNYALAAINLAPQALVVLERASRQLCTTVVDSVCVLGEEHEPVSGKELARAAKELLGKADD